MKIGPFWKTSKVFETVHLDYLSERMFQMYWSFFLETEARQPSKEKFLMGVRILSDYDRLKLLEWNLKFDPKAVLV